MSGLKVRLYQASPNPSHPCRGETTKLILLNYISVSLPFVLNLNKYLIYYYNNYMKRTYMIL